MSLTGCILYMDIFDDLFFRDYDEVFLNKGGEGVWGSYTSKNVFLATNDKKKQFFSL